MKNYTKIIAAISAAVMALTSGALLPAHSEYVQKIVVLGDSISTGQSLGEGEKSYVQLLEEYTNVQIQSFAQENYTSADVLGLMQDEQVQAALEQADAIIIAIGEHDIMDGFIEEANAIVEEFNVTEFPDIFTASLEDFGLASEEDLMPYSNRMAKAVRTNQDTVIQNILDIDSELEEYPNAKIIWQTMYNLLDTIEGYDELSFKRKSTYNGVLNPAKNTITKINEYIQELVNDHEKCAIVDVYSEFSGNAYQYTNLYQLDMNPNAAGHAKIAEMIIQEAELSRLGDVNNDKEVNASDASEILQHAASVGAGSGGIFTDEQIKGADVDGNGVADSRDAAQVLSYAAAAGAGGSYIFEKDENVELVDPDPTQPDDAELVDPDPTQPE